MFSNFFHWTDHLFAFNKMETFMIHSVRCELSMRTSIGRTCEHWLHRQKYDKTVKLEIQITVLP